MTQVRLAACIGQPEKKFYSVFSEQFSDIAHNSISLLLQGTLALFKHSSESLDGRDTHKRWHIRVKNRLTNEDSHNPLARA